MAKPVDIKQLCLYFGVTENAFGEKIGAADTLRKAMSRPDSDISIQLIRKIITTFPEINPEWLITGAGEMVKAQIPTLESGKIPVDGMRPLKVLEDEETYRNRFGNEFRPLDGGGYLMKVPIIPEYARGGPMAGFADPEYFDELPKHEVMVDKIHKGKYIAMPMIGESMDCEFKDAIVDGALVTGRECQKALWKNKLHLHKYKDFIIAHKDGFVVKRIIEHDVESGTILCHSLNPDKEKYADFTLHLDDVDALFNIIRVENPR